MTAPEAGADIEVWSEFTGPDGAFFQALVDKFNAEQQQCRASHRVQLGSIFNQKVVQAALGGTLPHALAGGYDRIPFLASEGVLSEIQDIADLAGFSDQTFPAAIWSAGTYNGVRYGIPLDTHPAVFFYNKALFEQAGLDPEPAQRTASVRGRDQGGQGKTDADGYQMVASGRRQLPRRHPVRGASSIRAAASGPTPTTPRRRSTATPASRPPTTSSISSTTSVFPRSRATRRSTPSSRATTPWSSPASGRPPATPTPLARTWASRRSRRSSATAPGAARTTSRHLRRRGEPASPARPTSSTGSRATPSVGRRGPDPGAQRGPRASRCRTQRRASCRIIAQVAPHRRLRQVPADHPRRRRPAVRGQRCRRGAHVRDQRHRTQAGARRRRDVQHPVLNENKTRYGF